MAIIKSDGHGVWGFELPTKGWHNVVVHETIEIKGTKKDEAKKMLCIPFCFDGSDRPSHTVFCMLSTVPGLRRIVDVVVASGVSKDLLREKKVDLTVGVDEEVLRSDKFLHYVMAKLPGKVVAVHVDHGIYESVAEDGTTVKKPQVNITEIRAAGDNASQKPATQATKEGATVVAQTTTEDTGGW